MRFDAYNIIINKNSDFAATLRSVVDSRKSEDLENSEKEAE